MQKIGNVMIEGETFITPKISGITYLVGRVVGFTNRYLIGSSSTNDLFTLDVVDNPNFQRPIDKRRVP